MSSVPVMLLRTAVKMMPDISSIHVLAPSL